MEHYNMNQAADTAIEESKQSTLKAGIHAAMDAWKPYLYGYPQTKRKNRRNPNSPKPRVLVSGRNFCSNLCMARSLGKEGYEVEILQIFKSKPGALRKRLRPDAYSKYVKAYYTCVSHGDSTQIVKKLLSLADQERKMLLLPADDLVASIADEYMEELRAHYLQPNINNESGAISRMMSKAVQKDLARAAGLPVVNSSVIRMARGGVVSIPETVKYPCFVKPNISKNGLKSRMRKCESEAELRNALAELSQKNDIEMLVEDYIEIGKEYSLLGLCTKDGVVAPGFFAAEEGGHGSSRGVAITGKILPCSQQQKLIEDISNFVGTLNYEGLFDVDLIETTDGKMYFVELNLRFGGSGYAVTESGVNLPAMFADYMLLNKPVPKDTVVIPGKTFLSEKVLMEEYISGFLTLSEVKKHMAKVDITFVKDEQDPGPYRYFKRIYVLATLKRWIVRRKQMVHGQSGCR